MKRILAILLTLLMLLSLLPASVLAATEERTTDVWEEILQLEDQVGSFRRAKDTESRAAAYAEIVPQIIEIVESSENYVPGSIIRHGDFFYWDETDGTACGYSPRLRAQLREGAQPDADPEAFAEISTVSYADRGGWPGSTKVAAFQPYIGIDTSFTAQYENECKSIAQALGGTATTYKTTNATIDNIAQAIESSAVVIFDSHGDTDYASGNDYTSRANTSYICLQSGTGITSEDQDTVTGPYGSYKHAYYAGGYGSMKYYCVDGTAISNHMTGTSPNGLLWMAICLGMATDGMHAPLRAKGVEVAYGYSQSVTFSGDYAWEAKFWGKMKNGSNVKDAIAYMKQTVGCPDPYTSSYPAYPITVSSEDVYPGHGNVDKQQTVNSTWTLFTQHEIQVVSNNSAWGTVTLSGFDITATPATGYYVDGYEILDGQATVTRNGNVFTVTPETDCTIQINFASRDPAVVSFSVPEGVSCDAINAYIGDEIILPTPTGTPAVEGMSFRFLGWAAAPTSEDTMTLPEFLQAGSKLKLSTTQITYYALYSYFIPSNGLPGDEFVRVDAAPASWVGEYVLTYNGEYALNATSATTKTKICTKEAVINLEKLGCVYEGNVLRNVVDDITYVVSASENGTYTVKMKTANHYLAMDKAANSMTTFTSSSTNKTRWNFTMTQNGVAITNAAYNGYTLQYAQDSGVFCPSQEKKAALTLFAKADGDTWYTTQPKERPVCEEHTFGEWMTDQEPTCTEAGSKYHVCTVCGARETEPVDPLGHDYAAEVTAPTCLEGGYTTYTCTRCEDTYTGDETAALGHDFGDWTVTTQPTCTEAGVETRSCTRCDETETRPADALGHDWDEGTVTVEPKYTIPGEKTFTCTRCGETRTEEIACLDDPFEDVSEEDFFFNPVLWALDETVTGGIDETHFAPNQTVMRADAMVFFWAAKGRPEVEEISNPFKDVKTKHWYYNAVMWAVKNGITGGTDATHFSPKNTCSRSEILQFLYAAMGKPEYSIENPYSDVKKSQWYYDGAIWAYEKGLEKGENGKFQAKTPCTRGYVVTYLYRFTTGQELAQ